jgi:hypothetical protein
MEHMQRFMSNMLTGNMFGGRGMRGGYGGGHMNNNMRGGGYGGRGG